MRGGRVLMVAHHFPPAGGSGSNRALAFARHLPGYGWQPIVVTPEVAWAMNRDDALMAELPRDIRVVRTRSFEQVSRYEPPSPGSLHSPASPRGRGVLRSHLGHLRRFPDAHIGWLPFALAAARRERFDLIYSSSGPFTAHLAGMLLKRISGKPWVAELRDGWYRWNRAVFPDYPAWRDALERRLEAAAIQSADRVVLVTERMADAFRDQYSDLPRDHFAVVANGFDPAQFEVAPAPRGEGWELVHAGALYYGRSLSVFLDGAARLAEKDEEFARAFRLTLIGTLDIAAAREVTRSGMKGNVELRGQVNHPAAIATMRAADALLLIANTTPGAEATVPAKLFEYLAVGRPILAVAPSASSTADVLNETGGGCLAEPDNPDGIACALRRAFREPPEPANKSAVARFDRSCLTQDLARLFDEVTSAPRRL